MEDGLRLVKAHVESFFAGRTEDYARQVTADYRHHYLPDTLGEGPEHVRRWREMLFSIYHEWRVEISDEHEHDERDEVIVRLNFIGRKPADPNMPPTIESSAVLLYEIQDGKLSSCNSLHPVFEDFDNVVLTKTARTPSELH